MAPISRNAEVIMMPLSEPFVHSRAFLSLRKQPPHSGFVSTWSQKCPFCLQSRRSACIPLTLTLTFLFCILPEQAVLMTTALKAFCWGNTCGNILCTAGRARGTSFFKFIYFFFFVADVSPPQQLHRPLFFKEPVIKLTTPRFQSNQTLLLDLIVFQLFSSRWKIKMLT